VRPAARTQVGLIGSEAARTAFAENYVDLPFEPFEQPAFTLAGDLALANAGRGTRQRPRAWPAHVARRPAFGSTRVSSVVPSWYTQAVSR
jgi:hypothetical protein